MFMHARGKMFDWLERNERDNSDCGRGSPSRISPATTCSVKIFWPFMSTCWHPETPDCSGTIAFMWFIARAAMTISAIRRFPPTTRQRRRQSLSRYRQPGHRPQNGKGKA